MQPSLPYFDHNAIPSIRADIPQYTLLLFCYSFEECYNSCYMFLYSWCHMYRRNILQYEMRGFFRVCNLPALQVKFLHVFTVFYLLNHIQQFSQNTVDWAY